MKNNIFKYVSSWYRCYAFSGCGWTVITWLLFWLPPSGLRAPSPPLTWPCALLTSAACCRLSATCAAMTRCRSTTRRQQAQRQSLQRQKRLWPFKQETTPWFRQRAHFGLRDILRGFCWWRSEGRHAFFSPPSPRQLHCPAHPSGTVTSGSFLDWSPSSFAVVSSRGPPSKWNDI